MSAVGRPETLQSDRLLLVRFIALLGGVVVFDVELVLEYSATRSAWWSLKRPVLSTESKPDSLLETSRVRPPARPLAA